MVVHAVVCRLPASKQSSTTFQKKTIESPRIHAIHTFMHHQFKILPSTKMEAHRNSDTRNPTPEPDQLQENLQEIILSVEVSTTSAHVTSEVIHLGP